MGGPPDGVNIALTSAAKNDGPLFSPRGTEVRAQTERPQFHNWFGESKVVNAEGNPLVVYYGSKWGDPHAPDFAFKTGHDGYGRVGSNAFYFTDDRESANEYIGGGGTPPVAVHLAIESPLDLRVPATRAALEHALESQRIRSDDLPMEMVARNIEGGIGPRCRDAVGVSFRDLREQPNELFNAVKDWTDTKSLSG